MKSISIKIIRMIVLIVTITQSQTQKEIEWPTLADTDWPMIKHDPQFTGRSPYKGPQTPTVIWEVDMEDGIFSGPVIGTHGDLLFGTYFQDPNFEGLSDYFYRYSSEGRFIWEYKLGRSRPPQTGIVIDSSGTVYFGSLDRYVYALNPDGTLKWEFETSAPIFEVTIPNIDLEGNIYITNDNGELYSLKPDGSLRWQVRYDEGFWGKSPVFAPDGQTMYIAGGDSGLYAIGVDSELKWKFGCGEIQRAPTVDNEGFVYFQPNGKPQYLYSLLPSGNTNWKYLVQGIGPAEDYSIPTIDHEGNIYIVGYDSTCCPYYLSLISVNHQGDFRWKYLFDDYEIDHFFQPLICDAEGTVYVGSTFGNYYYAISNEGGLKWKLRLNNRQIDNTGAISKDGTLYLGVHGNSLFTGYTSTLIAIRDTGVVSVEDEETPTEFALYQNYPNPFNPSTTIKFTVPNVGTTHELSLRVYDILGREIATLVNETKPVGTHEVEFDASELPSGIFFYRLQSGDFTQTKKMMVIK